MPNHNILTSIHGRRAGLTASGDFVTLNQGVATALITSAQVLALNATEQTIVAAPGAGKVLIPRLVAIRKPAGTAYADVAAGEDLVVRWTDDSGALATPHIETTGFLDQTTAQLRFVNSVSTSAAVGDMAAVANSPLVLHLLVGEITTGDSDLYVRTWFDVVDTTFTLS